MNKVLIVIGDATETVDTRYPYYRLQGTSLVANELTFDGDIRK